MSEDYEVTSELPRRLYCICRLRRTVDGCSPGRGGMARTAEKQAEHFMAKWIAAERKPGLDYGMQLYARTSREGPRRGQPKASGLVLVRSPLLTSHKWRDFVSSRRLVCRRRDVLLWCFLTDGVFLPCDHGLDF